MAVRDGRAATTDIEEYGGQSLIVSETRGSGDWREGHWRQKECVCVLVKAKRPERIASRELGIAVGET